MLSESMFTQSSSSETGRPDESTSTSSVPALLALAAVWVIAVARCAVAKLTLEPAGLDLALAAFFAAGAPIAAFGVILSVPTARS